MVTYPGTCVAGGVVVTPPYPRRCAGGGGGGDLPWNVCKGGGWW